MKIDNGLIGNVYVENIPQELKEYDQWLLWKWEINSSGKSSKVPYTINGTRASPTDPTDWGTFIDVINTYTESCEKYGGIGFAFSEEDPFIGIDLDKIIDEESDFIDAEAHDIVLGLNSYVEYSPSKTGCHVIIKGERDPSGKNRNGNFEIYSEARYFTMTGDIIEDCPTEINEANDYFDELQERVGYRTPSTTENILLKDSSLSENVDEIIEKCMNARNSQKFIDLFEGNCSGPIYSYPSPSEADMALCCIIAYYTDDESVIFEVVKQSNLFRDKWEKEQYRKTTIGKAIASVKSDTVWQGIKLPPRYKIKEDGLYVVKKGNNGEYDDHITYTPIVISAICHGVDEGKFYYEVTFRDPQGNYRTTHESQSSLLNKNCVQELVDKGLNITANKYNDLSSYFSASINSNVKNIINKKHVLNNGWKKDQSFVIGDRLYSKDGLDTVIQGNPNETKGLVIKGSLESWKEAVEDIIKDNSIRFKMYCAMSSFLLEPLNSQSYILDHSGETSTGKTFGTSVAFSLLGNPEHLMLAGDSSPTYLENYAAIHCDLPIFIDESSVQSDEGVLKKLTYMLANGIGKGRGTNTGGIHHVKHWNTVAFITGEKPITGHNAFGGQQVRVIEIHDKLPKMSNKEIKCISREILKHHGHIADMFVRKVFEQFDSLEEMYDLFQDHFTNSDSNTMNRLGDTFALIALAGKLLEEVFQDIGMEKASSLEVTESFFKKSVKDKPIVPYYVKALQTIDNFVESHMSFFIKGSDWENYSHDIKYGWIADEYIDFIPSELKEICDDKGISFSRIKEEWHNKKILRTNANRKDYRAKHFNEDGSEFNSGVFRINRKQMNELLESY